MVPPEGMESLPVPGRIRALPVVGPPHRGARPPFAHTPLRLGCSCSPVKQQTPGRTELVAGLPELAQEGRENETFSASTSIANLSHEDGVVTFRAKNYRQGRQRKTLKLSGLQ